MLYRKFLWESGPKKHICEIWGQKNEVYLCISMSEITVEIKSEKNGKSEYFLDGLFLGIQVPYSAKVLLKWANDEWAEICYS